MFGEYDDLMTTEEAKEALKHCKYRDPMDSELADFEKDLEFSEADFSTREAIEAAFTIDMNREYRPSIKQKREQAQQDSFGR